MFQKEACHGIISLQEARKRKNNPEVVVIEDESFTGIEMQTYVQLGRRLEDIGEGTSAKGIEFVYHILPGEQKTLYYDVSTVPDFIP